MPLYSYSEVNTDGEFLPVVMKDGVQTSGLTIQKMFSMRDDKPEVIEDGGKRYRRDFRADFQRSRTYPANWPMEGVLVGVPPAQAGELAEFYKSNGLNVEVRPDGIPIFADAEQFHQAKVLNGWFDRNSWGTRGDRAPNFRRGEEEYGSRR